MKQKLTARTLIKRVISFATPFRKPLIAVFMCSIITIGLNAIASMCYSKIFDLVQKHGVDKTYLSVALVWVGVTGILAIARILINSIQAKIEISQLDIMIPNYLNHKSISRYFQFSGGQHLNEHSGVSQAIISNGTSSIQNQISMFTNVYFQSFAQFFIALIIIFYAEWFVGIIFIFIGVLFFAMMLNHNKKTIPDINKLREQRTSNSRLISEIYRHVNLVINECQEERSLNDLGVAQGKLQNAHTKVWIPGIKRLQNIRWFSNLLRLSTMFLSVYLMFDGPACMRLTVGSLFLIFTYSGFFIDALWQITNMHRQFMIDRSNIEKYFDLLEIKPDIVNIENPIRPDKFYGNIEFRNVCFYYPKRVETHEGSESKNDLQNDPVLKSVSFKIEAGQKIGIVGESGSGKSTLSNLLMRMFDPQMGQILIDGNDLRLLDLKLYLRNVGNVAQDVVLFDRSMRENILFGLNGDTSHFTDEKLASIAKMARIDAFFTKLEHGFETIVGEKGIKLSGGERQRVGVSRALAKEPSILIFDEATSSLDSTSEKIVQESIDRASFGKTAIIIAHRLSTVIQCDKILVFRHGILLAEGTHSELLSNCEYYAELVKNQSTN